MSSLKQFMDIEKVTTVRQSEDIPLKKTSLSDPREKTNTKFQDFDYSHYSRNLSANLA